MEPIAGSDLPSIENLRCFVGAARLLNFRAAAKAVALTPAAFGQRIRQLEGQLGVPLFRRTTHQVRLTEAGLALLPAALAALAAAEACVRAVRDGEGPALELVLGTRHELGLSWILPLLPLLERRHPRIVFNLYFGSGEDLLLRVRTQAIDCAVGSMRLADPKLDALALHPERYLLVASPALLDRQPLRRAADAAAHTLIDISPDLPLFSYLRRASATGGALRFGQVRAFGTIEAIRQLVLRGTGVAVLPEYLTASDLAAGNLQRVLPRLRVLSDQFQLIFRRDDPRRSVFEGLADTLRESRLS